MIHLESDYNNGAHAGVLQRLVETNDVRSQSYGDDEFSWNARKLIRDEEKECEKRLCDLRKVAGKLHPKAKDYKPSLSVMDGDIGALLEYIR
ncbi:MAG: hypothetical protein II566_05640 [Lachnospiraceae bacterium]|nr:hypothetical protein [Lachnospiraceae bacterium]